MVHRTYPKSEFGDPLVSIQNISATKSSKLVYAEDSKTWELQVAILIAEGGMDVFIRSK